MPQSQFRVVIKEQKLMLIVIPCFLLALGGIFVARFYLTGASQVGLALLSFLLIPSSLILAYVYYPYIANLSNHLNLRVDTCDEEIEIFYKEARRTTSEVIVSLPNGLKKYETTLDLTRSVDLSVIKTKNGTPLYSNSEICTKVSFRHWDIWEKRIHLHWEVALWMVPIGHKASETINCRALVPDPFRVQEGKMPDWPCFEIVTTLSRDLDRLAPWQAEIWSLVFGLEAKQAEKQKALVTIRK